MKDLFTTIETLVPTMGGWCTTLKAQKMAAIIIATEPEIVCEIGVFFGRSAIPLAMALKEVGKGRLIAIDPYDPIESGKNENETNRHWWENVNHETVLGGFRDYMRIHGVEKFVQLERKKSDDYAPPLGIGLLHVDGSHGEQAIRDMKRYCPCVKLGGYVVADDIHWVSQNRMAVSEAVQWAEENGFVKIYEVCRHSPDPHVPVDDWCLLQKQFITQVKE